jgi:hypothetical protein
MDIQSWMRKPHPMHISTYLKISYKVKTMSKEQKELINKGMNINV